MEWLHIVVITLIYIHEPKTVTWAKECEIPDYAYSEKRRKNQYGDEFVCVDRDVERDYRNSLYDTKLLSINTRKKIEDFNEDDKPYTFFKENRDPRYIQNNHYIHTVLQPPTNKSTFQMLLHRFQPYGYGPYTMDTPKSVFNIYRTKSQDYEEDSPKELKLPAAQPAKEDVTTNWGMEIYTRQANDVNNQNHESSDQKEEFKISKNQKSTQIVTKKPIWTNENTDNNNHDKLLATNKVDILEPKILMGRKLDLPEGRTLEIKIPLKIANIQDIIKPLPDINTSTNNTRPDEKLYTAYENMVNQIMSSYNSSDKTNADNQILMNDKKKIFQNKFNKFKYLNPTFQIANDVKASALGHQWKQNTGQQRMPMRHLKQKKGPWRKDNPTLASMPRSFNEGKLLNQKTQNIETKISENNPENEKIQDHYDLLIPENKSAPDEYESEAQKVLDSVQPDNMNTKLGEGKHHQADTITTFKETVSTNPLADTISSKFNKNTPSDAMKKIEIYPEIAPIKAKIKNPGWAYSFFNNHLQGSNSILKEHQESIANPLLQCNNADNPIDQNIPYYSNSYEDKAKHPRKLGSNEFREPLSNQNFFQGARGSEGIQIDKDFTNNLINNKDTIQIVNSNNICSNNPEHFNIDEFNNKLHGLTYINEDNEEKNCIDVSSCDNELQYLKNTDKQKLEKKDTELEIPVQSYLFNKRYKREDKNTMSGEKKIHHSGETKTDVENSTKSLTLNESKGDRLSSTGEPEYEIKINSNETHIEVTERTVDIYVNSTVNYDFNNEDVMKPTSCLEKLYKKLHIIKSRDKDVKNRGSSNLTITDNDVRDIRTVEKEKYKKEFDHEFLKKWMELQQAFMSHLERQNIPKFPVMNAVKSNGTLPPQYPVELKLNDNFNGFPIKLKESEERKIYNKQFLEANDVTTIVPLEVTAINNETQENRKRDIHCCFKLNDGQHCGEHDNDIEQLKQIDLKIENKKMKGCPLKETCIEMILTKDKMIRDEDKSKLTNHSSTGNVFNDEMPPFRIGVKNYTNGKSKVSKIQGMRDFNKINSLTKVNKSQDKWEKQIKKLYEIINEEKKGEERNKTTYSSLHNIKDKDQSRKLPQSQRVLNILTKNDPAKNLKEEPHQNLVTNTPNHIFLESKPGQNISTTDQMQKLLNDKKSRKILANHIISECYNLNANKETVDPLKNDLKVRYQHVVNKFRDDLMKIQDINHNNNSSYIKDQSFYTEGIKVNSPVVNISQGLQSKVIKGKTLQNSDILLHKVYKSNPFIPNTQIKAKLLKKCENLKSNISQILILMSELQDEGKNYPDSMKSCLQYAGFNNLLNNLRKFNRRPSFSSKFISGKDVGTLSKLRMGTINLKDLGNKHEKADGINVKYIDVKQENVNSINLRGVEEDRNSTTELDSPSNKLIDTIDIRQNLPTVETNEECTTSKGSAATVLKSPDISVEGKLSLDVVNAKVSEEIQNNVPITQNGKNRSGIKVTDATGKTNTDQIIAKGSFDHVNENNFEVSKVRKFSDEISGEKNYILNETRQETLNDKYVDSNVSESIPEVHPSLEMINEVTSEKGSDLFLDRGQHFPNESILDSISGKSIIKLVQKETPGFDKYSQSSTASPSDSKEDTEIDKPSNENEPYIIKLSSFPTNYNFSNSEKSNKKLGRVKCLSNNNSSGVFDMSKFTKIADQMQDIPHKLTMPIIIDIMNSLMFCEKSTHSSEKKEDPIEKRLKRNNFTPSNAQISPSENFEINMKVKKGKRKKNKKNKALIHKFTRSKIKATTEEISIKSAKRNKNEQHKKNRIKPIYMPNLRGHSGIHVVPPFLFGDNIITISVTPCDDYYKNKKNNKNKYNYNNRGNLTIEEIKNNDTSMVTEAKYFVMSNIKGDVTEKAKTRQETQLRIPLKFFRSREKTTTIAVTPESRTRKFTTFYPITSDTNFLHSKTELNSFKVTDFLSTTRIPKVKLKNENQDFNRKFEKLLDFQDLKLINTSNEKVFDPIKPTELYDKIKSSSTEKIYHPTTAHKSQTPQQMEFTFTITLKPPRAQNLKTPIENISYFVNTSHTSTRKNIVFKKEKLNQSDLDYDTDYQATENQLKTSNWMSGAETAKSIIFDSRTQMPVTDIEIKQYLVTSPPSAIQNQPGNKEYNFKDQLFKVPLPAKHTNISPFKYGYRTTPRSPLQTHLPQEFKDTDYNIIYQDFKEFKNDENLESLKANITKENLERDKFEQTSEVPLATELVEDYIFNIEQQTDVRNDSEITKEAEANQYDIKNEEIQLSTDMVAQTKISDENEPNEDSTEIQYDDELESVIETFGERPKLVSLYQSLASTEPITEALSQTESEESFNNLVLDYGIPVLESNQEITQNQDNMVLTEIIQVQPQTELPNQHPEEKGGQNYSMIYSDWYKGYQNDTIPNSVPEDQNYVIPATYIVPTGQEFEEGYKYEESSNEDEDEDSKDKEENNDNNKDEENGEGDINMTTVKLAEFYQNSPPTETLEDEPEEDEEYDDDSTDFQELLFWQNITKKPSFQLKQPYILPIEMQSFKSDIKTNTTNPIQEADVKAMKLELEQLKQLLDKNSLADKKDPFTNLTSTPTINYFTQELTSEKLMDAYAYGERKIYNKGSEVVGYPGMEKINMPRENIIASKEDNRLQKNIEEKSNSMEILNLENDRASSKHRNLTYLEEINKPFLDNPTTIAEESENDKDDYPTDEGEEEDLEISSNDPVVVQFDDLPETIDASNAMEMFSMMDKNGIINQESNIVRANYSKFNESKFINLENPSNIPEMTNQVELPPTPVVNANKLNQLSLKEINQKMGNDTVQIESAKRYKANYWSAKKAKAPKAIRTNPIEVGSKENISSNLKNDRNSEVILLDNVSNDPADWVLHEDAMWNMDPWESFKQLENNKFNDGSSKGAIERDKLLKDIMMSKIEMDSPKFLKEKDRSTINFPNQNNDDFRHHSNLFVKLDREPFQSKSHNLFDQISRKYIKAPHHNNKYNKNKWNDGTIVLFRPNFSALKDKYSEENEKNLEMQPSFFGNNSLGLKGPRLNLKGVPKKANSNVRNYTQDRQNYKISSSKKSKIHNKSSKHHNPNSKKKLRSKQKIQNRNTAPTYRNTTNNLNTTAVQNGVSLAASNFTHGQNNFSANKTESSPVNILSSPTAPQTQSKKDYEEVNQLTTPGPNSNLKVTTNLPSKEFFKAKINKYGNLENLLWDRDDRWDRLDDNLNKVEKLYDRNIIKKINQNFRKNMYGFDTKLLDQGKGIINSSRKSNQKSLMNFYKQRLNRKMTLLKSLQNKNSEDKITPEEEKKIKKILDGIVSRYKGRTKGDTENDNYMRFKTNKYNVAARRNLTRIKNHRKFPKIMKLENRNNFKCKSKERYFINNLTDTTPQHRFISVGRNKKLPIAPIYNRLAKQYGRVKDRSMRCHPIKKISGNKNLLLGNYVPQSEKENNGLLHRDKKNYVLGLPYIRTFPNNNSTSFVSIINTQLKKLPNFNETESFNSDVNGIIRTISGNSPDNSLYSQKRGKFVYKINDAGLSGTPIHGILSLVYPDDAVSNISEPIKECNGDGTADYPMDSSVAGYSGTGIPFNNYQINNNQFEELLKSLENCNSNITENSENKYKDLAMLFKENQKDSGRNRSQDTVNEVKAKLKAINWLLNFKNSQKINKMAQYKQDVLQSTSCSKQDGSFMESPGKDREEDVENMKKFITKYKTLLKMFEEQYGKIDIKDAMNQRFMKNYREDIITKDGNILVQRPTALWKKLKSRDKNPLRMDDTNKNIVLDSNSKKKSHKISYMYGQNKQRKDMDNSPDDIQDNEDLEVIKPLQDNDDDNLETCNDIEFESYDEHQLDKIKEKDLAINNMSQIQLNGTRNGPHLQPMPAALLGKYKNLEKYKSYHNGQIPRLKSYRENEGNYRLNSTINKLFKSHISPLSCIGELNYEKSKGNWDNWTLDKPYPNAKLQQNTDEPQPNMTIEDKEVTVHGNDNNNVLMLPIKFNTSDFIKLLNFKDVNESDSICQDEEMNPSNYRTKLWDINNRNGYVFDVDRGGPNGIKNRYYITFDSLSPNTVKVKNVSTIPMSNFSDFVNMVGPGLNVMSIHKFMSPWDKNVTQSYIDNRNVKGNIQPEIRSIEKVCLWLRKPLSYNLTHQVPKVAISLGEVWPPMSEGQGPQNMKHYLVQVDPLLTLSKFPNQHIDYPSQISKVVWKAILHGFKTPKKTWQYSNQLG